MFSSAQASFRDFLRKESLPGKVKESTFKLSQSKLPVKIKECDNFASKNRG